MMLSFTLRRHSRAENNLLWGSSGDSPNAAHKKSWVTLVPTSVLSYNEEHGQGCVLSPGHPRNLLQHSVSTHSPQVNQEAVDSLCSRHPSNTAHAPECWGEEVRQGTWLTQLETTSQKSVTINNSHG